MKERIRVGQRQQKTLVTLLLSLFLLGSSFAYGEVVVIGRPDINAGSLTKEQVNDIFLGKLTTLLDGMEVKVLDQKEGSASRDEFYQVAAGKTQNQLRAYWTKLAFTGKGVLPEAVADDKQVKERVAATPGMLGYVSNAAVDGTVKVLWRP